MNVGDVVYLDKFEGTSSENNPKWSIYKITGKVVTIINTVTPVIYIVLWDNGFAEAYTGENLKVFRGIEYKYMCNRCKRRYKTTNYLEEYEYSGGKAHICKKCIETAVYCKHCNKFIMDDMTSVNIDGYNYCSECVSKLFIVCDICNTHHPKKDVKTITYVDAILKPKVCINCMEGFKEEHLCSRCNNFVNNHTKLFDGVRMCSRCIDLIDDDPEERINAKISKEDIKYIEDRAILNYSYKPETYLMYGVDGPLMGVELECSHISSREECAAGVQGLDMDRNMFYIKSDSSLQDGIEVVSMPMTYTKHKELLPWSNIIDVVKVYGGLSHNGKDCGMHVHVSKSFFENNINTNILKIMTIFEKFWDNIVTFSRRRSEQVDHWCKKVEFNKTDTPSLVIEKHKSSGRYSSVNLVPSNTIELRIFRGTLNINTLFATLEFVSNMCIMCKNTDIQTISTMDWSTFVRSLTAISDNHLSDYLAKRKLI